MRAGPPPSGGHCQPNICHAKHEEEARQERPTQAVAPRPPSGLAVAEWQTQLRRQFGGEQPFTLENLGSEPVFSEFMVANPVNRSRYRVAIRGTQPGENFCACADFATNDLGTCKTSSSRWRAWPRGALARRR